MKLNQIRDNPGARHAFKRLGRGIGSGLGKTSGRGGKGQTARSGVALNGFEGGQTPLHRRLPKRGFNNVFRRDFQELNLVDLQKAIDDGKLGTGETITGKSLATAGVIRRERDGLRLLGTGKDAFKAKVTIEVAGASKSAVEAVEKAGGKVVVLDFIRPNVAKDIEAKRARQAKRKAKEAKPAKAAAAEEGEEKPAKAAKPAKGEAKAAVAKPAVQG
jgi:large subunit ribosomal protein L15